MSDNYLKIIESAYPLFMENGYKATKTTAIAEAAGVNESTVFRNFKNKENLFHASIDYYVKKALSIDFDILSYSNKLEENLRRMVETMFDLSVVIIPSFRLLVKVSLVKDDILDDIENELSNQKNIFGHYIQGMIIRNMIREIDAEDLVDFIFSKVFVNAFEYLMAKDQRSKDLDRDDIIDSITDNLAKSIRRGAEHADDNRGEN